MKRWSRYTTFALTILMVLAISAMQVVPVLADDGAPPPPEATEVVDPAAGGAVPPPEGSPNPEQPPAEAPLGVPATDAGETPAVEEAPVLAEESPVSNEAAPALAEAPAAVPAAAETPLKESDSKEEIPAEVLAQLPENTEVVILDENGEALSLATQEAEDILYSGDPVWCPVGVLPGSASCSDAYSSLNELVANFIPPTNGVIWIENTDVTIADVLINGGVGGNWETAKNYSLTLKGGWNGLAGGAITDTPSTMDNSLTINNWNGNITLSDIVITGASATAFALSLQTSKTITLTNVDVVDNTTTSGGAYLDNIIGSGNVVVKDSTFSGNSGGTGLIVRSRGNVTARNLSAHNNSGTGVDIDTSFAPSAKSVIMTGSNNFNNNGGTGLSVYARGAITLSNVTSTYNGGNGASLDNCAYDPGTEFCTQPYLAGVTLKGSSNFSNNGGNGLNVVSGGSITAANLTANYNGAASGNGQGANLYNWGSWSPKPVTLTGFNTFNGNAGAGLWIDSWGTVITNNLDANENGNGAACTTEVCDGVHVNHSATFLLAGYGRFNRSGDDGLEVHSWGVVTLNNLYAEENNYWGVSVINHTVLATEAVNVLGTNVFLNNLEEGLYIETEGAVTLTNITANGNGGGVYVRNTLRYNPATDSDVMAGKNVTLKGINTFNNNAGNGLTVFSTGVILASGLSANDNGSSGAYLDNCFYDGGTSTCIGLPGKAVTLNGNNSFSLNGLHGLWIASLGNIKVNNLASIYNDEYGALLNNDWTKANGSVTITGFANTSWNGSLGLGIYSRGAVLTNNLTANNNGPTSALAGETFYRGVDINNAGNPAKLSNVTLLGVNTFNNNWNTGLFITSYGNVLLNNITATGNGEPLDAVNNPTPLGTGVYVANNIHPTAVRTVTLNGINFFNNNLDTGLDIRSRGAVIVSKPTAIGNGVRGVNIENDAGISAMPVTILGYGAFNDNGAIGLAIFSNGNITLNNILASGNNESGVALTNENFADTAAPVNVTLNGVNTFNNNGEYGLVVFSDGTITINNITANENGWSGAYLDNIINMKPGTPRNIVLKGWGTFINNGVNSLEFHASGAVTLTRIIANVNGGNGVAGTAGSSITFTCGSLFANTGSGYALTAGTTITLKGVYTYGNGAANSATPPATITRTCPLP